MKIAKIDSSLSFKANQSGQKPKHNFNYVKATGYGALGAGLICAVRYKKRKQHKYFAALAGILTLAHIAILESYRFKTSKK